MRRAELGLDDAPPPGAFPADGQTADLLIWALVPDGIDDPVEGIVAGVRDELAPFGPAGAMLAKRLDVAILLLRRSDNRSPTPPFDPNGPTLDG